MNLTAPAVQRRIKNMQEMGVIAGNVAVVNHALVGFSPRLCRVRSRLEGRNGDSARPRSLVGRADDYVSHVFHAQALIATGL
ncbi:hypothetical protein [Bosea lathyri]|uniref:hypothetical protein n=1 Tax=Bosea lathyri TaxID=1036778 RepID=UPI003CC7E64F